MFLVSFFSTDADSTSGLLAFSSRGVSMSSNVLFLLVSASHLSVSLLFLLLTAFDLCLVYALIHSSIDFWLVRFCESVDSAGQIT